MNMIQSSHAVPGREVGGEVALRRDAGPSRVTVTRPPAILTAQRPAPSERPAGR